MEPLYNIYYAAEVLDGHQQAQVRAGLGKLFKANDATLDKLFSGTPQLVKKECDKVTALKYKQAMEKVGAKPMIKVIKRVEDEPTAAERIAALAKSADVEWKDESVGAEPKIDVSVYGLILLPVGYDVLRPNERQEQIVADIDTSTMVLSPPSATPVQTAPEPPPAPETDHLSMGGVGEDTLRNSSSVSLPIDATIRSSPDPPTRLSSPDELRSVSSPSPPKRASLPEPVRRLSSPDPPNRVSSPDPPNRVSPAAPPKSWSAPDSPRMLSLSVPPVI